MPLLSSLYWPVQSKTSCLTLTQEKKCKMILLMIKSMDTTHKPPEQQNIKCTERDYGCCPLHTITLLLPSLSQFILFCLLWIYGPVASAIWMAVKFSLKVFPCHKDTGKHALNDLSFAYSYLDAQQESVPLEGLLPRKDIHSTQNICGSGPALRNASFLLELVL